MEDFAAKDAAEKANSSRIGSHEAVGTPTYYEADDASGSRPGS